jgi:hypothetical protein
LSGKKETKWETGENYDKNFNKKIITKIVFKKFDLFLKINYNRSDSVLWWNTN